MSDPLIAPAADTLLRVTLLAAAIAVVLAVFRIRSNSARHAAWTAALVAMLLMPVLSRVVPSVPVSIPSPVTFRTAAQPVVDRIDITAALPQPLPSPATGAATAATAARMSTPAAPPTTAAAPRPVPWRTIAVSAYFAGVGFFLIRLLVGIIHLARIGRNSRAVFPFAGSGDLFESALVATPVTVGLLRPRIVLPSGWRDWPADMLAAVVAHERAHVLRRDPLIAVLARLNCALYFFHPAAWWLDRQLAIAAEHVCDDAAVKEVTGRRYAETLLAIAATVRQHQGRLVWQGVGVNGDGQLGRRIDRVLTAAVSPEMSRTRGVVVAAACALVIAAAIACRQETRVAPLRADPQVAADVKQRQEELKSLQAAEQMTAVQAAALEHQVQQNPEDLAARKKLLIFYARNRTAQDWKAAALGRRPHILWLIEHHPESEVILDARLWKSVDPGGYVQARKLWLATIAPADVSPIVLSHAATFFESWEKQVAERILLRGQAQQPDGPKPRPPYYSSWSSRLGTMYAYAIIGARLDDPDSVWARQRLEQSTDARLLYAAGYDLSWRPTQAEMKMFGQRLLERASQLDPEIAERVSVLLYQRAHSLSGVFGGAPRDSWPALLDRSTGVEKLQRLAVLSESEYMSAEYLDWLSRQPENVRRTALIRDRPVTANQDKQNAAETFARSKSYARQALELGKSLDAATQHPDLLFRAHIAYGLNRLREGDRDAAVEQLLEASRLPLSAPETDQERFVGGASTLEYRLVNYLLKNGERQGVIEYLERSAPYHRGPRREEMLKSAAAIRDGRMPEHYQRLVATGSL
jgi:hypothetical protein